MDNKFEYSYSSLTKGERKAVESIMAEYEERGKCQSMLDRVKELDSKVKKIPLCVSLAVGIIGTLIFGFGLTMVLEWSIWLWGILTMLLGIVPMLLAYPIFSSLKAKLKDKYGKEIVKLSSELLNE